MRLGRVSVCVSVVVFEQAAREGRGVGVLCDDAARRAPQRERLRPTRRQVRAVRATRSVTVKEVRTKLGRVGVG